MILYIFLFLTILSTAQIIVSSERNRRDLKNSLEYKNDAGEPCITALQSCSVTLHGEKGDKGERGPNGAPGERGSDGARGDIGLTGREGRTGDKGDKGERGLTGMCLVGNAVEDYNILPKICDSELKKGPLTPNEKLRATCDSAKNMVCIDISKLKDINATRVEAVPFWLSQNYDFSKIYDDANKDISHHISWIRERTRIMKLRFIYECYNSLVVDQNQTDRSLQFLTWNDVLIGNKPTDDVLLHYTVENDECSQFEKLNNTNKWMKTFINIEGPSHSLPVMDMRIGYFNRTYKQEFKLRLEKMCFE